MSIADANLVHPLTRRECLDPFQFYSCFISYASKDHAFAERLHADLQNKGVRCWFVPEDMKIGDRLRSRIDETIRYSRVSLELETRAAARLGDVLMGEK